MNWLNNPYIDLTNVADKLYGGRSRFHNRNLQDRHKSRFEYHALEVDPHKQIKEKKIHHLSTK